MVAAGKVGAANAFAEKNIPAYEYLLFLTIKTNAGGRMAGR